MFLGIPLEYRNDQDIANAVSTFGRFHHWHHIDGALDRTLVYASFPSPALIPRDIVFGQYSNLGAVKESWTAPCYILSADFAEVLPADEDPMPLDGNPHPLPGQMLHNLGNFVLPAYPELGWNDDPFMQHEGQPEEDIQENEILDHDDPIELQDSDSIVFNHSENLVHGLQAPLIINAMTLNNPDFGEDAVSFHQDIFGPALLLQWCGTEFPPRWFQNFCPSS
jgi:hypothetical protein